MQLGFPVLNIHKQKPTNVCSQAERCAAKLVIAKVSGECGSDYGIVWITDFWQLLSISVSTCLTQPQSKAAKEFGLEIRVKFGD